MSKTYFKSYIWLLETLQSHGSLTLKELQSLWLHSAVNDEGKKLAPRTFSNHIRAIFDIFGIEIVCDRKDNTYYIDNEDDVCDRNVRDWMLDALSLGNLLNESLGLKDRIVFENAPSGYNHLATVISAIRDNDVLDVVYHSYQKEAPESLILEPYCLREHKKRWYLYARKGNDSTPHMFALDRIQSMVVGKSKFSLPKSFDVDEYFSGVYGPRVYSDMKCETVVLKVSAFQSKYFMSLPLHKSQEILEETLDYTIFKYHLVPDYDFRQDVLSFGDQVEILEPSALRKDIAGIVSKLNLKYNL